MRLTHSTTGRTLDLDRVAPRKLAQMVADGWEPDTVDPADTPADPDTFPGDDEPDTTPTTTTTAGKRTRKAR